MNPGDKKILLDFYEDLYLRHGPNFEGSGWPNPEDQIERFSVLTEIADLEGRSVLDVGCGFGDLYSFLDNNFENFEYTGIDISGLIIDAAREKYPGVDFRVHDILEEYPVGNYDYVLLSGAFNPRLSDNWSFIRMMVSKMYEICNYGIAFNMFSDKVDYMDKKIHYQNRDQLREFCTTLTDNIIERDDYMRFEFTVYLYKKA